MERQADARYHDVVERVRAKLEPGLGRPSSFPELELSPDGRRLAVVCQILDTLEGQPRTELRVFDLDTGADRTLTGSDGSVASPRWLPDGTAISFLADHGHPHRMTPWIATILDAEPAHLRELASPPGVAEHLRVSPDGTRLALVMAGGAAEQADGLGSGTVGQELEAERPAWFPEVETSDATDAWRSAWVVDIASGVATAVSPDGINVWEAGWMGDDALVAVVSGQPAEDAWYGARLVRFDVARGGGTRPMEPVLLYQPEWQIQFAEGSPDGTRVAVIEGVASDRYFVQGDIVICAADGSGVRSPGWLGADLSIVRWDGPDTLFAAGVSGFEHVVVRIAADGDPAPVELQRSAGQMQLPFGGMSAVRGRVAVALTGPDRPDRLLLLLEDGRERLLLGTDHAGHDLIRSAIAERRIEAWSAPDGTTIQGLLVLPHGEPPFATILWIHGGPVGSAGGSFLGAATASLVDAGYAIVFPNPRGSTGRGRDFAAAVVGDMGGPLDSGDLLAAMDHLVGTGVADPDRLVCAGVSYGGYMSALLPAVDGRFAAAFVGSPLTDLVSSYYGSSLTRFVDAFVGGRPDEVPDRYLARSSVFAGARLRTPSLITAGLRDRATPVGQAMEHFRALREQGTPAELVVYPQEGHGVRATEAILDWTARLVLWLERFAPPRR